MILTDELRYWRFWTKVLPVESGCWEWQGCIHPYSGYGQIKRYGKTVHAHRYSHMMFNGPVPEGMEVMHSCDNRKCVRPGHLSTGTRTENMQDMARKGRNYLKRPMSHCKRGHLLSEENRSGDPSRRCLACVRLASRRRYERAHPGARVHRGRKFV